jgi:osmotically-inducible protein OsmY
MKTPFVLLLGGLLTFNLVYLESSTRNLYLDRCYFQDSNMTNPIDIQGTTTDQNLKHLDRSQAGQFDLSQGRKMSESDTHLAAQVDNVLSNPKNGKRFKKVSFIIRDGNVTLNGTVKDEHDRDELLEQVRNVSNVRNIDNRVIARDNS